MPTRPKPPRGRAATARIATAAGDDDPARASGRVDLHRHPRLGRRRMLGDVGHRLLHDAVAGHRPGRVERGDRPDHLGAHRDPGGPVVGQQVLEILERRRRPATVVVRGGFAAAEHADRPAHLVEALAADTLGVGQRGVGLVGIAAQQMTSRGELQHHDRERVPEHVVDIARDPLTLVERRLIGDQGTRAGELVSGKPEAIAELAETPAEAEPHHPVLPAPVGPVEHGHDHRARRQRTSPHTSTIRRRGSFSARCASASTTKNIAPSVRRSGRFSTVTAAHATTNGAHAGTARHRAVHEIGTDAQRNDDDVTQLRPRRGRPRS